MLCLIFKRMPLHEPYLLYTVHVLNMKTVVSAVFRVQIKKKNEK